MAHGRICVPAGVRLALTVIGVFTLAPGDL